MNALSIVRLLNFIFVIVGLIGWFYFYRKFREPAAIAPLTWLVNIFAFYLYRYFTLIMKISDKGSVDLINLWATILYTHAGILLVAGAFVCIYYLSNNKIHTHKIEDKLKKEAAITDKINGNI